MLEFDGKVDVATILALIAGAGALLGAVANFAFTVWHTRAMAMHEALLARKAETAVNLWREALQLYLVYRRWALAVEEAQLTGSSVDASREFKRVVPQIMAFRKAAFQGAALLFPDEVEVLLFKVGECATDLNGQLSGPGAFDKAKLKHLLEVVFNLREAIRRDVVPTWGMRGRPKMTLPDWFLEMPDQ